MPETFESIKQKEEKLLCRSYSRYPLAIIRGEGVSLWDSNGREYTDLLAGLGVVDLGHCNPEVCEALEKQSRKLWHVSNLFYQEEQLDLAELLLSTTHHDKAFFCNSGAEANEAALKLARRYMAKVVKRDAYEIITLNDCFHGRTFGALAATGRKSLADGFEPLPEGFKQVPADLSALEKAITTHTAAVMVECVQGEGGVKPLPAAFLQGAESLCRKHDILLICDEVQCGLCRTGKFWAFQHFGIMPDIITVAKGLANGLPLGAMLATQKVAQGFEPGSHATTFGGNALASAAGAKVIEIMLRDNIALHVAEIGADLMSKLLLLQAKYPDKIKEVRGMGLMIGIELREKAHPVWTSLLEAGFICNITHDYTIRLLPPLIIGCERLDAFLICLDEIIGASE